MTEQADVAAAGQRDLRLQRRLPGTGRPGQGPATSCTRRAMPTRARAAPSPRTPRRWATAKAKAQATYDKLKALQGDPAALLKEFEAIAKTDSKDTTSGADGGQLGWFTQGQLDRGVRRRDLRAGSQERRPRRRRSRASTAGTSSSSRSDAGRRRTGSTGSRRRSTRPVPTSPRWPGRTRMRPTRPPAATCGWVARYQLDPGAARRRSSPPRSARSSATLQTADGYYVFLVRDEQTRKPDGAQLEHAQERRLPNWYTAQRAKAVITPDLTGTTP